MFNQDFFFENPSAYEIMLKNIVEPDTQKLAVWYGARALRAG
jgi:hypothetical protein